MTLTAMQYTFLNKRDKKSFDRHIKQRHAKVGVGVKQPMTDSDHLEVSTAQSVAASGHSTVVVGTDTDLAETLVCKLTSIQVFSCVF